MKVKLFVVLVSSVILQACTTVDPQATNPQTKSASQTLNSNTPVKPHTKEMKTKGCHHNH